MADPVKELKDPLHRYLEDESESTALDAVYHHLFEILVAEMGQHHDS